MPSSSFANKIKKIDLFGKPLIFEEGENQKHSTLFGIISSILIIITCIIAGFYFGKEIYERKNPIVYNSNDKIENSIVRLKEFPVFFSLINGQGVNLPDAKRYIDMELTHFIIPDAYTDSNSYPKAYYYSGYKNCNISEYSDMYQPLVKSVFDQTQSYDLYCILYSNDLYFEDEYSNLGSSFINVRFLLNKSNSTDEFKSEQDTLLKDLYILSAYVDSYIDSSNYKEPINYFQFTQSKQVSIGLLQRMYFNIERLKLITHKGWLFDNIIEEEVFSTRSSTKDVTIDENGNLYWVTFSSPNVRTKIVRNYTKVQDTLAKIGGFFNALFILATIILKHYVDFSYYKYIYKYFYKFKKPENALTKTQKSMVHKHTIDKIVQKIVINELNQSKYNVSYDCASNIEERYMNNINNVNKDNNKDASNQNNNINNNISNLNKYDGSGTKDLVGNNNGYINNNNSNNALNPQLINNFIHTVNKRTSSNINNNNFSNSNIKILTSNINVNHNNDYCKTSDIVKSDLGINLNEFSDENIHYFSYVWNDLICFRNIFKFQKKVVQKVISFKNLLEVNYDHFIKTDITYADTTNNNNKAFK